VGKVRISLVKRAARKLLVTYPNLFGADFEHNKQVVSKLCITYSKKVRNQIAGYVTHLVKITQRPQQESEE